ncbi:MAG: putative ABC transporter permease subunit [Ignavibacteria bacterium]
MRKILHILKYKFFIFLNYNKSIIFNRKNLVRSFFASLIFFGFGVGTYLFSYSILHFVMEEIKIGLFLLHRFSSILLFVFFISISAGNIVVAYSMIFKNEEVFHLITRPIEFNRLFILKMFESIFYSSPTFLLIGSAILTGYGIYFRLDWFFYPFAILFVFLPFVFLSAILGVIFLIGLIQIADKIGIRWTISIVIVIYLTSLIGFFNSVSPKNLVDQVMKFYPHLDLNLSFLDPSFSIFLPNHWFAEALFWFSKTNYFVSIQYALLINLIFLALLIIAILIGSKLYYKSFQITLELKSKKEFQRTYKRIFPSSDKILNFNKRSIFNSQTEVLLKKEFHQFFRDAAQWMHLGVIIFLILIFVMSIAKVDLLTSLPFLKAVTYLSIFIFNSFLISSITLRFVYPVLSIEAHSFWKIKSAPIDPEKILKVKFIPIFIFTLLIAESLNYFSHLSISIPSVLKFYSSINIFSVTLTLSSLNLIFGSYFVTFNEKNPVKIASSQGATIAFLFNMIYLVFLVVILFYPTNDVFNLSQTNYKNSVKLFQISSAILFVIGIISSVIAFKNGIKALKKDY